MFKSTRSTIINKAIVATMAFLFVPVIHLAAESDTQATSALIYFSLPDEFNAPLKQAQTVFDCSDKIYTVLELNNYPEGRYELSVQWHDPAGQTRETTRYPFFVRETDTRLWSWLRLSRAPGAGMLQWIDPAAGLEEFIGIWEVEVRIGKQLIAREQFEVTC